jgi:hypothetical protein
MKGKPKRKVGAKVDQLMVKHLNIQNIQGRMYPRGRLCCFGVKTKLEPFFLAHVTH